MAKTTFLKKPSKRWRGFPPGGMFMGGINHQTWGGLWHCFTHINLLDLSHIRMVKVPKKSTYQLLQCSCFIAIKPEL